MPRFVVSLLHCRLRRTHRLHHGGWSTMVGPCGQSVCVHFTFFFRGNAFVVLSEP